MSDATAIFYIYLLAGGLVFGLAWAGIMGEILLGNRFGARVCVVVLAVVGLLHPVAAIAGWDLLRLGDRSDRPDAPSVTWAQRGAAAVAVVSTAATLVAMSRLGAPTLTVGEP